MHVDLMMCSTFKVLCFVDAVFNHAVVVNGTGDQSNQILGCAIIRPDIVANETREIRFPRNDRKSIKIDRFPSNLTHTNAYMH